jgi:hypothetical protein
MDLQLKMVMLRGLVQFFGHIALGDLAVQPEHSGIGTTPWH